MFGRNHAQKQMQRHRQQFMNELGESAQHFRRAAGHFAQGTAMRLGPTYDRARVLAGERWMSTRQSMAPMYQQMRENAMTGRSMRHQQRKLKHKMEARRHGRMRMLRGLLIAGAAVGAASAAVARRRRMQAEWAEYEPMAGFDQSRYAESQYGQSSAKQKVAAGAATMADSLSSRAGRAADSLHDRSTSMPENRGGQPGPGGLGGSAGSMGTPGSMRSSSTNQPPMSQPRERLGDPALDFPDER